MTGNLSEEEDAGKRKGGVIEQIKAARPVVHFMMLVIQHAPGACVRVEEKVLACMESGSSSELSVTRKMGQEV